MKYIIVPLIVSLVLIALWVVTGFLEKDASAITMGILCCFLTSFAFAIHQTK